jgi:glutamate:GABA antiporter
MLIGFVPPSQFGDGNSVVYALVILAGIVLIGLLPVWLILRLRKPNWQTEPEAAS